MFGMRGVVIFCLVGGAVDAVNVQRQQNAEISFLVGAAAFVERAWVKWPFNQPEEPKTYQEGLDELSPKLPGFKVVDVPADGTCFFHAVGLAEKNKSADFMEQLQKELQPGQKGQNKAIVEEWGKQLRKEYVEWVKDNWTSEQKATEFYNVQMSICTLHLSICRIRNF